MQTTYTQVFTYTYMHTHLHCFIPTHTHTYTCTVLNSTALTHSHSGINLNVNTYSALKITSCVEQITKSYINVCVIILNDNNNHKGINKNEQNDRIIIFGEAVRFI